MGAIHCPCANRKDAKVVEDLKLGSYRIRYIVEVNLKELVLHIATFPFLGGYMGIWVPISPSFVVGCLVTTFQVSTCNRFKLSNIFVGGYSAVIVDHVCWLQMRRCKNIPYRSHPDVKKRVVSSGGMF